MRFTFPNGSNPSVNGLSITDWGNTGGGATATINIAARSAGQIAPEAFHFDVTVADFDATGPVGADVYDDRYHDLYYYWDFDDAYTFAAPVNLAAAHKNAGIAYGPTASHTFRAVGTYSVSILIVEPSSGKTATATLPITIGAPVFSGVNTRFVDTAGNFTGKPTGASEYTTFSAAVAAADAAPTATPQRIMLRRGQTFTLSGQISIDSSMPSLTIVASDGGGAKPIINWTAGGATRIFYFNDHDAAGTKDFVMQDIAFNSDRDLSINTGTNAAVFFFQDDPCASFLLDGCEVSNFHIGIQDFGGVGPGAPVKTINDTAFMGFSSTCALETNQVLTAYTGVRMIQDPDAIADPVTGNSTISCVRIANADTTIFDACDMFNFIGWTSFGSTRVQQGAVRFNSAGATNAKLNVQRCAFEGGWRAFELTANSGTPGQVTNSVIEKCVFVGSYQTARFIDMEHSGITIRNNVFARPDAPNQHGNFDPNDGVIYAAWDGQQTTARDAPIRFYNNTLVNLMSGANFTGSSTALPMSFVTGFTDVTVDNNIDHQPNLTVPVVGDAPMATGVLWAPLFKGYRDSTTPLDTQYATPAGTVRSGATELGSAAIGDANAGLIAYDDMFGVVRGANPDRGARQRL